MTYSHLRVATAARWMPFLCLALGGCAGTAQETGPAYEGDPFETANRAMFELNEKLDEYLLGPISRVYGNNLPPFIRELVSQFFNNLGEPKTILNDFLQGKTDQGLSDTARFVFNTTIGIGGLFDVATSAGLPAHQEDFGQTLAIWGAPRGPYLFLPLFGPTTMRRLPDIPISIYTDPLHYTDLSTVSRVSLGSTDAIDQRYNLDDAIRAVEELALDPYAFTRSAYLQRRQVEISNGQLPLDVELFEEEEELEEDGYLRIE